YVRTGGVHRQVGPHCDARQQAALQVDGLHERHAATGEGMLAAGLAEAAQQDLLLRAQEHDLELDSETANLLDDLPEVVQLLDAAAGVDTHSGSLVELQSGSHQLAYEGGEQSQVKVVDAVVAGILQRVQGDGL